MNFSKIKKLIIEKLRSIIYILFFFGTGAIGFLGFLIFLLKYLNKIDLF
jgi:hypothetical protein